MSSFDAWIKTLPEELDGPSIGFARMVWQAAQAAERERERGKVLAEGWDDRYATAIEALVKERERAKELVELVQEYLVADCVSEGYGSGIGDRDLQERCRAAIAKYEGESNGVS